MNIKELHYPVHTGRKLNVHKTFRRRPGSLLNVLCMFNLRPVFTGQVRKVYISMKKVRIDLRYFFTKITESLSTEKLNEKI